MAGEESGCGAPHPGRRVHVVVEVDVRAARRDALCAEAAKTSKEPLRNLLRAHELGAVRPEHRTCLRFLTGGPHAAPSQAPAAKRRAAEAFASGARGDASGEGGGGGGVRSPSNKKRKVRYGDRDDLASVAAQRAVAFDGLPQGTFWREYGSILQEHEIGHHPGFPRLANQDINLWLLFCEVRRHGGHAGATKNKRWGRIADALVTDTTKATSKSFSMRGMYEKYMLVKMEALLAARAEGDPNATDRQAPAGPEQPRVVEVGVEATPAEVPPATGAPAGEGAPEPGQDLLRPFSALPAKRSRRASGEHGAIIDHLLAIGYSEDQANRALRHVSTPSVEAAVEWLIRRPGPVGAS